MSSSLRLVRWGAAVASVGLGAIGTLLSASFAQSHRAPDRALAAWPWNAVALAEAGARQLPDRPALAAASAAMALARQPVLPSAMRVLGLAAALRGRDAGPAMARAEALSRRDLPTQIWMIEDRVADADIAGALRHYDRALRGSDDAPGLLFPVLIPAAADPAVAVPLSRTLSRRPLWWREFVDALIRQEAPAATTPLLVRSMRLNPAIPDERSRLSEAMTRAVEAGRIDLAAAMLPASARAEPLRDGGFESDAGVLPFAWAFIDEGDLAGIVEPRDDGAGNALFVEARNGRGGEIARQLLDLPAARYRLTGRAGNMAEHSARPVLSIARRPTGVRVMGFPAVDGVISTHFTVPPSCRGQWLSISAVASSQSGHARPWIDDLSIARAP